MPIKVEAQSNYKNTKWKQNIYITLGYKNKTNQDKKDKIEWLFSISLWQRQMTNCKKYLQQTSLTVNILYIWGALKNHKMTSQQKNGKIWKWT